jgi:lysozyme
MKSIIDLSSNNGTIEFDKISGVDEIFIRASLGFGDFDKNLNTNTTGAISCNIPVSYYHFSYPHSKEDPAEDATKQANYFCDTISKLPAPSHLAVDLEPFNAQGEDTTYSQSQYAVWLQTFLDVVEARTGIQCVIYSYADYLNRHLPDGHTFGRYPLWIASYAHVETPVLPKGWELSGYFMWQYSETGVISGINAHVDLSKTK